MHPRNVGHSGNVQSQEEKGRAMGSQGTVKRPPLPSAGGCNSHWVCWSYSVTLPLDLGFVKKPKSRKDSIAVQERHFPGLSYNRCFSVQHSQGDGDSQKIYLSLTATALPHAAQTAACRRTKSVPLYRITA